MKSLHETGGERPRWIVSRPDRLGDVVLSTSCLAAIKTRHPRSMLYFLARSAMKPLLEGHPSLEGFVDYPSHGDWMQRARALQTSFQKIGAAAILHLHPSSEAYCAGWAAGIPVRVGLKRRLLTWALTHSLADARSEGTRHEAEYNFDLLQFLDIPKPSELVPSIHMDTSARETLRAKMPWPLESTPFVALHLTAFSPAARWPAARFAALARWILSQWNFKVVLVGHDAADPSFMEFQSSLPADGRDVLNLAGRTHVGELAWLLRHARLLVSRDTGPSHVAAAVECPVIVLFGRTLPALYGPVRWRPLTRKAIILSRSLSRWRGETNQRYWKRGFEAIEVKDVQMAVREILNGGDAAEFHRLR